MLARFHAAPAHRHARPLPRRAAILPPAKARRQRTNPPVTNPRPAATIPHPPRVALRHIETPRHPAEARDFRAKAVPHREAHLARRRAPAPAFPVQPPSQEVRHYLLRPATSPPPSKTSRPRPRQRFPRNRNPLPAELPRQRVQASHPEARHRRPCPGVPRRQAQIVSLPKPLRESERARAPRRSAPQARQRAHAQLSRGWVGSGSVRSGSVLYCSVSRYVTVT
ncbi:hypothetical protein TSACC_2823 [Terrimicrobium sacchariphilum]|uniref:Uncharacterized protein n=1 Tax=Terrimicrobium sacchariphilum TaxID=690879 RepID=A0A146G3N1_TERSA|nr:hypothetical protein TSACC_2823 [Terrimicrobium sacchariphilum]